MNSFIDQPMFRDRISIHWPLSNWLLMDDRRDGRSDGPRHGWNDGLTNDEKFIIRYCIVGTKFGNFG